MEYIFTDLPQYIRVTSRSEFSSSVVHSGSVLLFSEDGATLTAKLPDGSFVTVGGSGGTDVSDTTAEAANVQSGYYFYNSAGVKTEGTLTVSGGTDVSDTTATAADVLAGAVFHDSTGAVTTGTIPTVSASVTSGAVVVPAGYIPNSQSFPVSGGATDFYKCATVDTVNLTWTGYKAIFDSVTNTYRFSSTITSGLTYTVITPTVGKVYADGALIEAKLWTGIPENGLIRYAPMIASAAEDELENILAVGGSPTFAADSGILCAEMTDSYIGYQSPISGLTAYSLSIWMKRLQSGDALMTFSGGSYGYGGNELWIEYRDTGYISLGNGDADNPVIIITPGTFSGWVNIVLVWTGSVFRLYVNGEQQGSDTSTEYDSEYSYLYPYINSLQRATQVKGAGKYAAFRLYDRVLTAAEIAALAAEFTPTA